MRVQWLKIIGNYKHIFKYLEFKKVFYHIFSNYNLILRILPQKEIYVKKLDRKT
jgi:hypothetical protein